MGGLSGSPVEIDGRAGLKKTGPGIGSEPGVHEIWREPIDIAWRIQRPGPRCRMRWRGYFTAAFAPMLQSGINRNRRRGHHTISRTIGQSDASRATAMQTLKIRIDFGS